MKRSLARMIILLVSMVSCINGYAQDIEQVLKAEPLRLSGGLTLSNIISLPEDSSGYTHTYSYYLSGSLNTTLMGLVSVPISFAYTNNKLTSTVAFPFNRFSLTPTYKWVKLHIGYSQMTFSPYTMSGRDFMGGGIELTPPDMPWLFSAYFGRYNKAVVRDSVNMEPMYKRLGGGVKVGYKNKKIELMLNATLAKDVEKSLTFAEEVDTTYISPKSNIAIGGSVKLEPWERTTIIGEYAVSIVNNNSKEDSTGYKPSFFDEDVNITRFQAGKVSVSHRFESASLGTSYERVSPNYKSFSSYYNTNDFENITIDFGMTVADKVNADLNVGMQRDNLSNQEVNTSSQLIYSCNMGVNATEQLSANASISNIQSYVHIKDILDRVTQTNQYQNLDTLSFTELSFSASASVSYRWGEGEDKAMSHSINTSYGYQKASHEQENSQRFVNNKLHNCNINYQLSHRPTKINGTVGVNYNVNKTPEVETKVLTLSAVIGTTIVDKVRTTLSFNYSDVKTFERSNIINTRLSASYSFLKYHSLNCSLTILSKDVQESKIQLSANITYNLSLDYVLKKRIKREDKWNFM